MKGPVARADSGFDWSTCTANSTASLSFGAPSVNWLDSVPATWSVSLSPACPLDATLSLVEDTAQTNEAPQAIALGGPAQWAEPLNMPTTANGSRAVTPLRSLGWSLVLTDSSQLNPIDTLATANIGVNLPTGPLPGGQTTLTVTADTVDQRRAFAQAVQTPGAIIRIDGDVNLDLSGLSDISVAPNVQIIGDRSSNPLGPRLFTTTFPSILFEDRASNGSSHERFSGLRLDGGAPTDPSANVGNDDSTGILIDKPDVEVDDNEVSGWRGTGVSVQDKSNLIDRTNASTVWIHDNYIHDDQHPTGVIIGGGHGGGYGVEVSYGAYALVERNVFDYNRHAIAGDGRPGTGYYFTHNLILSHGGTNTDLDSTHIIDMHGTDSCWSDPFASDFGSYMCGGAGEYMDVEYNTVEYNSEYDVKLRGTPSVGMDIANNVFADASESDAIAYTEQAPNVEPNNTYGFNAAANSVTGCDFDGDGTPDTFLASGETWWYQSSVLNGRWVYLTQSPVTGSAIKLGDVNGDGLCDVTANGAVFTTKPAVAAVDTDRDGRADLVVVDHTTADLTVARSGGDGTLNVTDQVGGTFATAATAPGARTVEGDFNGDGRSDVALLPGPNTPWWTTVPMAFSNGDGTYTQTNSTNTNLAGAAQVPGATVVTGDFNGDGKTDIALVGGQGWTTIPVALSNGDGTFTVTNQSAPDFAHWASGANVHVVVGDFNHDGRADLALFGGQGWTTIPVAFSNGDGSFTVTNSSVNSFPTWATDPKATMVTGDFNHDGRTDVALVGEPSWTTVPVSFSNGDGTFTVTNQSAGSFPIWSSGAHVHAVSGDFNGDGKTDIALVGGQGWTTIPVAQSNGDGTFTISNAANASFANWASGNGVQPVAGDFDGDGRTDIALVGGFGWYTVPMAFSHGDGSFSTTNAASPDFAHRAQSS